MLTRGRPALLSLCQADHIMADEFSAELADGVAFVSGHDDDGRPVVVRHSLDTKILAECLMLFYFRGSADEL